MRSPTVNRLVDTAQNLAPLTADDPTVIGGYELLGRLGVGGMGVVYLGRRAPTDLVAIKVVSREWAPVPSYRARFGREVRAMRRVSGAFTARVVEFDIHTTPQWVAMTYVPGLTLAATVNQGGPLPAEQIPAMALTLLQAIDALHAAGIVHRDVKPSNVILSPDGPRVIDFGVASVSDDSELTTVGERPGSLAWMTPEQLVGEEITDASDVHAWAQVVCFAATGQGAFGAGSPDAIAVRIRHDAPDLTLLPGSLAHLRAPLARALDRDAGKRPSTAELAQTIRAAADHTTAPVAGTSPTAGDPGSSGVATANNASMSPRRQRTTAGLPRPHLPTSCRLAPSRAKARGQQWQATLADRTRTLIPTLTTAARRGLQVGLILLTLACLFAGGKVAMSFFTASSDGAAGAALTASDASSTLDRLYSAWSERDDSTVQALVAADEVDKFRASFLDAADISSVENSATEASPTGPNDFCSEQRFLRTDGKTQLERRCFTFTGPRANLTVAGTFGQKTLQPWR